MDSYIKIHIKPFSDNNNSTKNEECDVSRYHINGCSCRRSSVCDTPTESFEKKLSNLYDDHPKPETNLIFAERRYGTGQVESNSDFDFGKCSLLTASENLYSKSFPTNDRIEKKGNFSSCHYNPRFYPKSPNRRSSNTLSQEKSLGDKASDGALFQTLIAHKVKPKISDPSFNLNVECDLSESSQNIMNSLTAERKLDMRERYPYIFTLNQKYKDRLKQDLPALEAKFKNDKETDRKMFHNDKELDKKMERFSNHMEEARIQKIRSLLRERFLKLLISVTGGTDCSIRMYEHANVTCKIKAFHPNFDNIIVEELNTPHKMVDKAILRSNDIISIQFHNFNIKKLLQ